jgi:rRNA-processing protein FCF1
MASDRIRRNREEKFVILDSNAIMMLFEFSIDIEDELTSLLGKHHIVVPKPIIEELEFLSKFGKGKKRIIAKPALEIARRYDIVSMDKDKKGDFAILDIARDLSGIVVTNDRNLRKKLREKNLHVIYLRGKNILNFD